MIKHFATAPFEQESESSTIVFLVPDDVLKMPLAYWPKGLKEYREKVCDVLRFTTWKLFTRVSMFIVFIKCDEKKCFYVRLCQVCYHLSLTNGI